LENPVTRASAWKNYLIRKYELIGANDTANYIRNQHNSYVPNLLIDTYADNVDDPYARANMNLVFA